ncbi:Lrp/AsnC ligand binding domain-containing protein [Candidatus Woesearchaeota archaeon]|nr:Lrp/AsnC ligand binding domain-containing protein [Candidatus Woesearchaeota archaeon]
MLAYVLIKLKRAEEKTLKEELENFPEVEESHVLFGEWDMIAKVNVESQEQLASFMIERMRRLNGVALTSTLIVAA